MNDRRRQRPQPKDPSIREVTLSLIVESELFRLREEPLPRIDELAADIEARGQTTPLFVRPKPPNLFDLLSGLRRKRALETLGWTTALVRVFHVDDAEAYSLAISENQDRDSLTHLERANIALRLQQKELLTVEQIGRKLGCSISHVNRYLRVAKQAPPALKKLLQARQVAMHVASTFLDHQKTLPMELHEKVLVRAAEEKMSAAEFGRLLKRMTGAPKPQREAEPLRPLKNGAFVLSKLRFDKDREDLDDNISLLQAALKRARALKRKRNNRATAPTEVTE